MSLSSTVLTGILASESVNARELPIDSWVYGLITLCIFAVLAFVTASYRDVANRHRAKAEAFAARHGADHGEHGGH
ncbi:hypothetical protein BJ978_002681 [Agromyces terreus]|uniref:4-hydroxybenzoate polyprenyltransferase n=1 Tax=Agromyces terreus TaxID=424795 RepID=A0A9X2H3F0_9MICO|nr:hypothetical protein [Agromyces terreus]MCP2372005.1 hypothetical protein [Agromyces terreus]